MSKDSAAIRDQLGTDPEVVPIITTRYDETLELEEGPSVISDKTLGEAWIVGTATNGIVGVNTGTDSGLQQVVGGSGRVEVIIRVVNSNNVFHERFRDTDFKDSSAPNTADWNVSLFRLRMHTSSNHATVYNTIATSLSIFLNQQTVSRATLNAIETRWSSNDVITYFLSANGGTNWEEVTIGVEHIFTNTGNDLKYKVVFFGNGGKDTYIENPDISYIAA